MQQAAVAEVAKTGERDCGIGQGFAQYCYDRSSCFLLGRCECFRQCHASVHGILHLSTYWMHSRRVCLFGLGGKDWNSSNRPTSWLRLLNPVATVLPWLISLGLASSLAQTSRRASWTVRILRPYGRKNELLSAQSKYLMFDRSQVRPHGRWVLHAPSLLRFLRNREFETSESVHEISTPDDECYQ